MHPPSLDISIGIGSHNRPLALLPTAVTSANMLMWMDAAKHVYDGLTPDVVASDGNDLLEWRDRTDGARVIWEQTTGIERPSWDAVNPDFNGHPTVRADGSVQIEFFNLKTTAFSASAGEMWWIGKLDDDPSEALNGRGGMYELGSAGQPASHIPFTDGILYDGFASSLRAITKNPDSLLSSLFCKRNWSDATPSRGWEINGGGGHADDAWSTTDAHTVTWPSQADSKLFTDDTEAEWMDGDVAEILLYDVKLSAADVLLLQVYFAAKYGIVFA